MASKSKGADEAQGLIHTIEHSLSSLTQMVEDVRTRIAAIKAEREQMENTRISKAEALKRMDEWLDGLQKAGAVPVKRLTFRERHPIELIDDACPNAHGWIDMTTVGAAMLYFFRDTIRAKLVSDIDAIYATEEAIESADYLQRMADIDAKLFAAEMEEEKIIQRAEDSGLTIHRRPDANPRVLLEA